MDEAYIYHHNSRSDRDQNLIAETKDDLGDFNTRSRSLHIKLSTSVGLNALEAASLTPILFINLTPPLIEY